MDESLAYKPRRRKHKYPTDTEAGIRTLPQIRSLPSGQLTDEEFAKAFFDRFQAKALIMCYYDKDGFSNFFGRFKWGAEPQKLMRVLKMVMDRMFVEATKNLKEIQ